MGSRIFTIAAMRHRHDLRTDHRQRVDFRPGGAISNAGTLTVSDAVFSDDVVTGYDEAPFGIILIPITLPPAVTGRWRALQLRHPDGHGQHVHDGFGRRRRGRNRRRQRPGGAIYNGSTGLLSLNDDTFTGDTARGARETTPSRRTAWVMAEAASAARVDNAGTAFVFSTTFAANTVANGAGSAAWRARPATGRASPTRPGPHLPWSTRLRPATQAAMTWPTSAPSAAAPTRWLRD